MVTGADVLVFVGLGAMLAGLTGAFGWPYAAMLGGFVLFVAGGKLHQIHAAKPAKREQEAES